MDNGIFIGGDEQNSYRLHRYAEEKYAWPCVEVSA